MKKLFVYMFVAIALTTTALAQDMRDAQPGDLAVIQEQGPGVGGICSTGSDGRTLCVNASRGYDPASLTGEALESAMIAAAMGDAIPNPGDRFALRFNMAGDGEYYAGAVGFGFNANENVRLNLNVGQSESKTIVGGGFNLSF